MTYKDWMIVATEEWNGITVNYVGPEGNQYNEPFCFLALDEALSYGQICIDRLIDSRAKSLTVVQT